MNIRFVALIAVTAAGLALCDLACADDQPVPPPAPQTPVQTSPKAVPGWLIDVMPYVKEGKPFRLLTLGLPSTEVSMGAHNAVRPLTQNVWHHGAAQLNIYKAGDYGFSLRFDFSQVSGWVQYCFMVLRVGNAPVFDSNVALINKITEVNGSVALSEGNYDISYDFGCKRADDVAAFQKSGVYSVQILGPDDNLPRFFKPNELFTLKVQ